MRKHAGFTLIELLVTVSIIAILAALAAPSIGQSLANQRVKQAAFDLNAAFSQARYQAAMLRRPVELVFNSDGWYIALTETATDSDRFQNFNKNAYNVITKSTTSSNLRFMPTGNVLVGSSTSGTKTYTALTTTLVFRVCDSGTNGEKGYTILLSPFGTSRITLGPVTITGDTVGSQSCT